MDVMEGDLSTRGIEIVVAELSIIQVFESISEGKMPPEVLLVDSNDEGN